MRKRNEIEKARNIIMSRSLNTKQLLNILTSALYCIFDDEWQDQFENVCAEEWALSVFLGGEWTCRELGTHVRLQKTSGIRDFQIFVN
jgi:hypothetical protein